MRSSGPSYRPGTQPQHALPSPAHDGLGQIRHPWRSCHALPRVNKMWGTMRFQGGRCRKGAGTWPARSVKPARPRQGPFVHAGSRGAVRGAGRRDCLQGRAAQALPPAAGRLSTASRSHGRRCSPRAPTPGGHQARLGVHPGRGAGWAPRRFGDPGHGGRHIAACREGRAGPLALAAWRRTW